MTEFNSHLIERNVAFEVLATCMARATTGAGCTVAITGEAGIGKTSVIHAFAESVAGEARVLWGASEPLQTARPLGPLFDFANALDPAIATALRQGQTAAEVFEAVLDAIQRTTQPILMVLEDVHWADESTLDFIRFLGRRAMRLRLCLVITFRSDEIGAEHPLRLTLGDISGPHLRRIVLPPLSIDGVKALALRSGRDARALYATTGGNPFFVTELLAESDRELPLSVQDAVLARVSRLSHSTRKIINLVSVVPGRIERSVARAILGETVEEGLHACLQMGLLVDAEERGCVRFRHELARRAVEAALDPDLRMGLHRSVLECLLRTERSDASRVLHHAAAARDTACVLEIAPHAAEQAARLGAHKQAAGHYRTALNAADECPENITPSVRAQLTESWSYEAGLAKIDDDVIAARHRAIGLWRGVGNLEKVALNLRWLSRLHWYRGERTLSNQFLEQSLATLEHAPASEEKAWGLSVRSQMYMLNEDNELAVDWGQRAQTMAEEVCAFEVTVHALNNMGSALMRCGDARGVELLERSLALSLEHSFHEQAARVYTNVASIGFTRFQLPLALRFALEGLAFDQKYDLDSWTYYLEGVYAKIEVKRGNFAQAIEVAQSVLDVESLTPLMRIPARTALAEITLLTEGVRAKKEVADLYAFSVKMGEPQYVVPCLTLAMKLAWISGNSAEAEAALRTEYLDKAEQVDEWSAGELYLWRHLLGASDPPVAGRKIAAPFAMQMAGDIDGAASAWRALDAPVFEALALVAGNETQLARGIEQLEALGAIAFTNKLRESPAGRALAKGKRGPYAAAKVSAIGLTAKETDILHRIALGKSNIEIAEDLFRSVKTVEHHTSAVLGKLGAKTRHEAVAKARQLGLVAP